MNNHESLRISAINENAKICYHMHLKKVNFLQNFLLDVYTYLILKMFFDAQ